MTNSKGWLLPYSCVYQPYTAYEIRREMRVREPRQTAIAQPKRYFDIDTLKFDSDYIETISSYPLNDFFNEDCGVSDPRHLVVGNRNNKWFTPKDDDFDEECKKDNEVVIVDDGNEWTVTTKRELSAFERKALKIKLQNKYLAEQREIEKQEKAERQRRKEQEYLRYSEFEKQQQEIYRSVKLREQQEEHERQIASAVPKYFAYHPVEGARLCELDEYEQLIEAGWVDSPAKF